MAIDIGELLANRRHRLRMDIETVSGALKLSPDTVCKLESNQFAEIGTCVYVRGYLGLYAKYLGLDTATIIDAYNKQHATSDIVIRPSTEQSFGGSHHRVKQHSKTLSFALALMVFSGLAYGYRQLEPLFFTLSDKTHEQNPVPPKRSVSLSPSESQGGKALDDTIKRVEAASIMANDALHGLPVTTYPQKPLTGNNSRMDGAAEDSGDQPLNLSIAQAEQLTATVPNSPVAGVLHASVTEKNATDAPSSSSERQQQLDEPQADEQVVDKQPEMVKLIMRFSDESWIKATDVNGKVLVARIYKEGKILSLKSKSPLHLIVGRASAIKTIRVNGKRMMLSKYKTGRFSYAIQ